MWGKKKQQKREREESRKRQQKDEISVMRRYDSYVFSKREWVLELAKNSAIVFFLGILFFRSLWGVVLLIPYGLWRLRGEREARRQKVVEELRDEFKEVILSIAFSLQAGYAMEQTISVARKDLERLGESLPMQQELLWMEKRLALGETVEQLFRDLAERSGIEEIHSYAEILAVAKKQGGNLVQISKVAAEHIGESIQVQLEMEQLLAGKKLEKNIMLAMPYFILIYLTVTNPSYLTPLYEGVVSRIFMVICLCAIFAAGYWAEKIIHIRI